MTDSLKKRYFYKLLIGFLVLPCSLIVQMIVPRGLGPSAFGDFSFLTNFFINITNFFDSGTSFAFYTKLSQRPTDHRLKTFFFYFSIIVSFLIGLFVFISFITQINHFIWPKQSIEFVIWGAFFAIASWNLQTVNRVIDAYGLTRQGELWRLVQQILRVVFITIIFFLGFLTLRTFFAYNILLIIFLLMAWLFTLRRSQIKLSLLKKISKEEALGYSKEFYTYCSPLVLTSAAAIFFDLLDRWILQTYSGSVQQGYFSLSYQIGAICLLFTSSSIPLLMREFAIFSHQNQLKEMKNTFLRFSRPLFALTVFISVFVSTQASAITYIFGGKDFSNASLAICLMSLYPIHQTYGQINGSILCATGKTKLHGGISILGMILGILATALLFWTGEYSWQKNGAIALTLKMLLIQLIAVNIQLYFISKYLKISFKDQVRFQAQVLFIFFMIAMTGKTIISFLNKNVIIETLLCAGLYGIISLILVLVKSSLFGINQNDLNQVLQKIKSLIYSS